MQLPSIQAFLSSKTMAHPMPFSVLRCVCLKKTLRCIFIRQQPRAKTGPRSLVSSNSVTRQLSAKRKSVWKNARERSVRSSNSRFKRTARRQSVFVRRDAPMKRSYSASVPRRCGSSFNLRLRGSVSSKKSRRKGMKR